MAAGAAQPTRADEQHLRLQQLDLAGLADFFEQRVPRVADALVFVSTRGHGELVAGVLPAIEAADHGGDMV
jgi:hypothetical protein